MPYYYALGDREIVAHFRSLLRAAGDTPLLAYTFPARTGNELSAKAFRTLVEDGLAGLKDSTSDPEIHAGYLAAAPDAQIFVGSPSYLLESLRGGSRGGVAALANLPPRARPRARRRVAGGAATRTPSGFRTRSAWPSGY